MPRVTFEEFYLLAYLFGILGVVLILFIDTIIDGRRIDREWMEADQKWEAMLRRYEKNDPRKHGHVR